ncbi:MAG: hypothetical protein IPP15_16550 [Saprospiraceae bacterium]|uniref:Uncharacterized protein n=1 Tax=Candidatus Opimibacter skivensis TaxID=2982028 RepID=A0A9D7XQ95_9BACT|nr:hypothetical protein [Candidatus Opimibacter skivensis]
MLTQHNYINLNTTWDEKIKECCKKPNPDIPPGSDCCYDTWTEELKLVNKAYQEIEEEARQKSDEFTYVSGRRDQFKKWYDELTKANDLEKAICDQLEILICQVEKVGKNTQFTIDAIKILFCMIRDYFFQLDKLKDKYDALMNCIHCLKSEILVPGAGLMKLIEDYGVKLAGAQAFRDDLLKMVMEALALAEKIDLSIAEDNNPSSPDYGLLAIVNEWKSTLNCSEDCGSPSGEQDKKQMQSSKGIQSSSEDCDADGNCNLKPELYLPICNDNYYAKTWKKYDDDKKKAEVLGKEVVDLNKKKESLLACKQSLEAAIKEVNPKERCK